MRASLQLRLGQQLAMTPQLRQAIRLLQLSALELQQEVRQTLENNVMLEVDQEPLGLNSEADIELAEGGLDEPDSPDEWEPDTDGMEDDWPDSPAIADSWQDPAYDPLENLGDSDADLAEHLRWQLRVAGLSEQEAEIAEAIVDGLDEDGYLREDLDEICTSLGASPEAGRSVLARVQALDPPGVASRDLRECLLAQLRLVSPGPQRDIAMQLVDNHLAEISRHSPESLANQLGEVPADVEAALDMIRSLNPRPGSAISSDRVDYVIPDLLLVRREGRWDIELNPNIIPRVRLNSQYVAMLRKASEKSPQMQAQLQEARWLIRSLSVRNDTLSRVSRLAVGHQQKFFDEGDEAMRPLLLKDIAEAAEVHESTVSRVTANKYLHTPRGTIPLKFLFSQPLTSSNGDDQSPVAVRAVIRKLIREENPTRPLSDRRIADQLTERGIEVARRTVTKYREAMRIPASYERKGATERRATRT